MEKQHYNLLEIIKIAHEIFGYNRLLSIVYILMQTTQKFYFQYEYSGYSTRMISYELNSLLQYVEDLGYIYPTMENIYKIKSFPTAKDTDSIIFTEDLIEISDYRNVIQFMKQIDLKLLMNVAIAFCLHQDNKYYTLKPGTFGCIVEKRMMVMLDINQDEVDEIMLTANIIDAAIKNKQRC